MAIDITQAEQKLKQMQTAFQGGAISQEVGQYMQIQIRERYLRAARQTKFAPNSIGMRRASGDIIKSGSLFGIDTGLLFRDLTKARITDSTIAFKSDRPYARKVMRLFALKSPYAPRTILFVDNKDKLQIQQIVLRRVKRTINKLS